MSWARSSELLSAARAAGLPTPGDVVSTSVPALRLEPASGLREERIPPNRFPGEDWKVPRSTTRSSPRDDAASTLRCGLLAFPRIGLLFASSPDYGSGGDSWFLLPVIRFSGMVFGPALLLASSKWAASPEDSSPHLAPEEFLRSIAPEFRETLGNLLSCGERGAALSTAASGWLSLRAEQ